MPTISTFYGIAILMFADDHNPPHFHVRYSGSRAMFRIADMQIIAGSLPPRAVGFVLDWARDHQAELMENWRLCALRSQPNKIAPLP